MNILVKILSIIYLIFFVSCSFGIDNVIYVATNGDDSASGSIDHPLATLSGARDCIREMKASLSLPDGGISVYLRGGEYFMDEPLVLGPQDSGTVDAPIVYRSYPDETAILLGGRVLNDFRIVTDPAVRERLSDEAREKVLMTDLRALGIEGYKNINPRAGSTMHLFYNHKFMTMARYPDEGDWLTVKEVPVDRNNRLREDSPAWEMGFKAIPIDKIGLYVDEYRNTVK